MNLEDERKLKFDRRLSRRIGWVKPEELQAEIDSLPDSAAKMHAPGEDGERSSTGEKAESPKS